jgi:hypothetical protein
MVRPFSVQRALIVYVPAYCKDGVLNSRSMPRWAVGASLNQTCASGTGTSTVIEAVLGSEYDAWRISDDGTWTTLSE